MQHDEEDHSILEDDSQDEEGDDQDEFMDEDDSSSLSVPNESIDFDLVYSLHTFVATVDGQANVVKGDSLFLMDDSNSYWWLVRVLKTQEVGYIPAENIETPYERLARLNKHRNVDLAAASPEERTLDPVAYRAHQALIASQQHPSHPSHPSNVRKRNISFRGSSMYHYPPAVWNEEEQLGWEEEDYEGYDTGIDHPLNDEEDWDDEGDDDWDDVGVSGPAAGNGQSFAAQQNGTRPLTLQQQQAQQQQQQQQQPSRGQLQQQQSAYSQDPNQQRAMQQQQQQYNTQDPRTLQQQGSNSTLQQQTSNNSLRQQDSNPSLRQQGSREALSPSDLRSNNSSGSASPGGGGSPNASGNVASAPKVFDPEALDGNETRKISVTPSVAREGGYGERAPGTNNGAPGGPLLPSAVLAQQENERKRVREELEEEDRKRRQREGNNADRSASQQSNRTDGGTPKGGNKLSKPSAKEVQAAKEREKAEREHEKAEEAKGGKKGGVFRGLFGGRKEKERTGEKNVAGAAAANGRRTEEEYYARGGSGSTSEERPAQGQAAGSAESHSQQGHGTRVQQLDRTQQQAYQRYMETAPKNTAPQPSYGLQSESAFLPGPSSSSNLKPSPQGASSMKSGTNNAGGAISQFGERGPASSLKPGSGGSASALGLGYASMGMGGPGSGSSHQRPGSLLITAAGLGYEGGVSVPELSVMRVFAGSSLSTEATFKTVLLNSSTTASDLVKQAMQRFRVAAGEDSADYYLTVKTQVEGTLTTLQPHEKPLVVFGEMVDENTMAETLPTVKRSSITSISSLSSNLSMHPAIRRLPMSDFADDSAVKFYLNRYAADGDEDEDTRMHGKESEELGPEGGRHESLLSMGTSTDEDPFGDGISAPVSTNSNLAASVAPERFTSPSARFAMQVLIYPDDLPDGLVFDPHTEAIVPKSSLKDRTPLSATTSQGISQTFRRKVFVFPKNTTAAEVIEVALERFGISDGVVDGGDEVEDKNVKRRSASRVRYGLSCYSDGQEKELLPSSKVVDAFGSRPPSFRMAEQRRSGDWRRRSADATLLLGSLEDVQPGDPEFRLRRAVAYRMNNAGRNRLSAPLDELALSHLHAQRESITASEASTAKDDETGSVASTPRPSANSGSTGVGPRAPPAQLSRQEIIAAQRAATRANQRAILSAQANSEQGVDIVLPDKATIRSSRVGGASQSEMVRYSYIEPDGETYDISDIMEEEWRSPRERERERERERAAAAPRSDLLEGALTGRQGVSENGQHLLGEKIDRVLNKMKATPNLVGSSGRVVSAIYSDHEVVLPPPSRPERAAERAPSRSGTPNEGSASGHKSAAQKALGVAGGAAIAAAASSTADPRTRQLSAQSVDGSELSIYESVTSTPNRPRGLAENLRSSSTSPSRRSGDEGTEEDHYLPPASTRKRPLLVLRDQDFGLSRMMAVIEMNAALRGPAPWQQNQQQQTATGGSGGGGMVIGVGGRRLRRQQSLLSSENVVDDVLFGPRIDVEEMHPRVRELYEPVVKRLDVFDKQIDDLLLSAMKLSNRG